MWDFGTSRRVCEIGSVLQNGGKSYIRFIFCYIEMKVGLHVIGCSTCQLTIAEISITVALPNNSFVLKNREWMCASRLNEHVIVQWTSNYALCCFWTFSGLRNVIILHQVAPAIKEKMQLNGSMLIGYQPLKTQGFVNFFRIVLVNPRTTEHDLDRVIELIDEYGRSLWPCLW